jgi:hypothetical protein
MHFTKETKSKVSVEQIAGTSRVKERLGRANPEIPFPDSQSLQHSLEASLQVVKIGLGGRKMPAVLKSPAREKGTDAISLLGELIAVPGMKHLPDLEDLQVQCPSIGVVLHGLEQARHQARSHDRLVVRQGIHDSQHPAPVIIRLKPQNISRAG